MNDIKGQCPECQCDRTKDNTLSALTLNEHGLWCRRCIKYVETKLCQRCFKEVYE